jgi:hypothetical protein
VEASRAGSWLAPRPQQHDKREHEQYGQELLNGKACDSGAGSMNAANGSAVSSSRQVQLTVGES